jgi:hypothetical protein
VSRRKRRKQIPLHRVPRTKCHQVSLFVKPRTRNESVPGLPHPSLYASLGKDSKEIRQVREYSCVTTSCTCYMQAKRNLYQWRVFTKKGVCICLRTLGISPFLSATRPLDKRCSFLNIDILRFKQNAKDTKSFSSSQITQATEVTRDALRGCTQ